MLGISRRRAGRMEPRDLFALQEGAQARWNMQCALTAWSTYLIMKSIPDISKNGDWRRPVRTVADLLERFAPPGYVPEVKKKRRA